MVEMAKTQGITPEMLARLLNELCSAALWVEEERGFAGLVERLRASTEVHVLPEQGNNDAKTIMGEIDLDSFAGRLLVVKSYDAFTVLAMKDQRDCKFHFK